VPNQPPFLVEITSLLPLLENLTPLEKEQADAGQGQLEPGLVDCEQAGREPAEAGGFAGADPVFDAGVSAVPGLQVLDGSAPGGVSVAMTWCRQPSMVSNRASWAPGCGRSRRTVNRVPSGKPAAGERSGNLADFGMLA
jgi:hypothetical protein